MVGVYRSLSDCVYPPFCLQHLVILSSPVATCRNDREELALNIGGFRGAPDTGEFGTVMENHTGQSGPRTELLELLEWLRRLRQRQRFLGFQEANLTYMYGVHLMSLLFFTLFFLLLVAATRIIL